MNIALVDVDGRHFPNLALMKLAAYHRQRGDLVEWYSPLFSNPDRIYASKVFTFTPDFIDYAPNHPEPIKGGTGYDATVKLPDEIENMNPDYSIYPEYKEAYGFLTRGCIRDCPWCIVPRKEGGIREVNTIGNVGAKRRNVILLDNNFLAADDSFIQWQLLTARQMHLQIDFNQGLDARLIDSTRAAWLAACNWIRFIRMSCDTQAMIEPIRNAVKLLRRAEHRGPIFCYMLVQDIEEAEDRLHQLMVIGVTPFAQPYRDFTRKDSTTKEQRNFARFVNIGGGKLSLKMKFKDYYHK